MGQEKSEALVDKIPDKLTGARAGNNKSFLLVTSDGEENLNTNKKNKNNTKSINF